jgi:hypothetical protein
LCLRLLLFLFPGFQESQEFLMAQVQFPDVFAESPLPQTLRAVWLVECDKLWLPVLTPKQPFALVSDNAITTVRAKGGRKRLGTRHLKCHWPRHREQGHGKEAFFISSSVYAA